MSQDRPTLFAVAKKVALGILIGLLLVGLARGLDFPPVFQTMFFLYALLGAGVFLLLDAPSFPTPTGLKAVVALLLFYIILSAVYILGASSWPQYDPEDEKGKIEKILKPKRERLLKEHGGLDELLAKTKAIEERVATLTARLNKLAPAETVAVPAEPAAKPAGGPLDLIARGMEVYELHECYNCHKIGGKGGVKKRGPVLDNVGSFLTIEDIKKKIFDPTYLYAEGFEKEHKKGMMPDKYKDLMTEEELGALAAYLSTLKNPAADTPKPVFVKTKVEHGFTVYGYVRDQRGKGLAGVEVQAKPLKEHGHAGSVKTNPEGYYEIFLHLHNEDVGTKIQVSAQSVQKEIVANYDPNDKVTKRQASVDLVVS